MQAGAPTAAPPVFRDAAKQERDPARETRGPRRAREEVHPVRTRRQPSIFLWRHGCCDASRARAAFNVAQDPLFSQLRLSLCRCARRDTYARWGERRLGSCSQLTPLVTLVRFVVVAWCLGRCLECIPPVRSPTPFSSTAQPDEAIYRDGWPKAKPPQKKGASAAAAAAAAPPSSPPPPQVQAGQKKSSSAAGSRGGGR